MKEAMKPALEALEEIHPGNMTPIAEEAWNKAITALREALAEQPAQPHDFSDAYQGAREDLAIWKKRALKAEELNRKFVADINGQTFMGEPAQPQQEPWGWATLRWAKENADPQPSKSWVGLTEGERDQHRADWYSNIHDKEFRAIEAILKEKNT